MQEKVEKFLNELRNYQKNINEIQRLENKADALFYELTGVKGIRYDMQHSSSDPSLKEHKKLNLIEEIDTINGEIRRLKTNNDYLEGVLKKLSPEVRKTVLSIYVKKKPYKRVCKEMYMSSSTLFRTIERELKKIL